jgi:hypothetical protein
VKELDQADIGRMLAEVLLEEIVDACLKHEGIVDCNQVNSFNAVPAWLTTTRDTRVHEIVGDQEERLQLIQVNKDRIGVCKARTNSTHQPSTADLKYSSSVSGRPLRISTESTTDSPRLSLPPGTL